MPTPNRQYPFPSLASANDPPRDIQLLAEALDADVSALYTPNPVAPVYETGWGDYVPATFQPVLATRSSGGLIGVSGMFVRTGATIASTFSEQHVLTLPAGYRPAKQIIVASFGDVGLYQQRVNIYPDGAVRVQWIGTSRPWTQNTSWGSLAGLSFVAAS